MDENQTAEETVTETPVEAEATEPREPEEIWNIDITEGRVDDEGDPSAPVPPEGESEDDKSEESSKSSESDESGDKSEDVKEEKAEESDDESEDESEVEAKDKSQDDAADDDNKFVSRFSRRRLRQIERELLTPFTDPDTPINAVFEAFHQFDPLRSEQLFKTVIDKSVEQFPNEWLKAVTGLDVTVDDVKAKFLDTEQATERPDLKSAIEKLDEFYGDKWRDPANDADLVDDDVMLAQILRGIEGTGKERDAKIEELEQKLSELEPQVTEFKTSQEKAREQRYKETLETKVNEYRSGVEKAALPKLFEQKGLVPAQDDSDEIKALKESVNGLFEAKYGLESEFDRFISHEYDGREQMGKIVRRVGKYLDEAAKAEVAGDTEKAQSLHAQAADEQDALAVLTHKAGKAFLDNSFISKAFAVLEQNADLQRRLEQVSGRKEVVGKTATAAGQPWKDKLKENPFDENVLAERLGVLNR